MGGFLMGAEVGGLTQVALRVCRAEEIGRTVAALYAHLEPPSNGVRFANWADALQGKLLLELELLWLDSRWAL